MDPPGYSIYKNDHESNKYVNNAWISNYSIRTNINIIR